MKIRRRADDDDDDIDVDFRKTRFFHLKTKSRLLQPSKFSKNESGEEGTDEIIEFISTKTAKIVAKLELRVRNEHIIE